MKTRAARRPLVGIPCSTMDVADGHGVRRMNVPEPYVRRVEEAGGLPLLFPTADPSRVREYLDLVDAVLLIGGDDVDPALYGAERADLCEGVDRVRDDFEIAVTREARKRGLPLLGVCRGLQLMNVAMGGTLVQDIPTQVPAAGTHRLPTYHALHAVAVLQGSRLASLLGASKVDVNSRHHQSLARLAPGLVVSARAPDGVVEAAEAPSDPFFLGVQWHPERIPEAASTGRLFRALVQAANGPKTSPRGESAARSARGAGPGRRGRKRA